MPLVSVKVRLNAFNCYAVMLCFPFCLQTSLASLMTTLGQSHPYFVRCVKPNEKKVRSCNI